MFKSFQTIDREQLQRELKAIEKNKATSAWFNPTPYAVKDQVTGRTLLPETIYVGESNNLTPTWEDPALDVRKYINSMAAFKQGRMDGDKAKYNPWIGEWKERIKEASTHTGNANIYTGGVITTDDYTAINVINVMAEMLGTVYRDYSLEQAITRVATPSITLQIDTYTRFTASQDIDEGVTTPTKKGAFSRQSLDLKKDVGHIAFTDEVLMRPYQHNIYQTHVENAVQDLKRIKARKIATELELAADVAGSDWTAYTGEHSTADPYDQIGSIADTIYANGGEPNTLASADRVFRDFISNTRVSKATNGTVGQNYGARIVNGIAGLPTFTWYIDNELTNTMVTVYDKKAVILAQGPVRTAQYRYEEAGIDGYITRDWNAVKTIQSGLIRNITSVSGP